MAEEKYWERFTNSGKIEDYLAYRGISDGTASYGTSSDGTVSGTASDIERTGRGSGAYERNRSCNGNDSSVISYERVR